MWCPDRGFLHKSGAQLSRDAALSLLITALAFFGDEKQLMILRSRFAPSPTSFMHRGSVRKALFSWLYAHHHKGSFVLRIEGTDRESLTPENVEGILDGMQWTGLDCDEGRFHQTERLDRN